MLLRWVLIVFTLLSSSLVLLPSFIPDVFTWLPQNRAMLGLDLSGGTHLLLQVDFAKYINDDLDVLVGDIRQIMLKKKLRGRIEVVGMQLFITMAEVTDDFLQVLKETLGENYLIMEDTGKLIVQYNPSYLEFLQNEIQSKSVATLTKRIDALGTREATIQPYGKDMVLVQIPGERNIASMRSIIGRTAKLHFILVENGKLNTSVQLGGNLLVSSRLAYNRIGNPVVSFKFNNEGTKKFAKITKENIGKKLAIMIDNKIITSPLIQEPITNGSGEINGSFTFKEAQELALLLASGALPAPLKIIEERIVDPSLGSSAIDAAKKSAIVAFVMVSAFMIWIYKVSGIWASLSLIFNMMLMFTCVILMNITLTFPGLAGMILTIGMAVDSNVLIFERIKEELRKHKSKIEAVERGFKSAFNTILDSNITTLITAVLMFIIGTGPVRGFALVLSIGILASIISTVLLTKVLMRSSCKLRRMF